VDPIDRLKKTAAAYAAGNGCVECMQALLAAGVTVNARLHNDLTLLMWAAPYGQVAMVNYLLEQGADKNAKDNRGQTALDLAREAKQDAVVPLLQ
jgi:ankyrin repeat protein